MAKPFYSLEEVTEMLGKSEDEVREMAREGQLREFRDAGKIFFKAEEVDKLSGRAPAEDKSGDSGGDEAGGDEGVTLSAADDEEELPSIEGGSGGTSVIGLAPVDDEEEAKGGDESAGGGEDEKKEDTVISASGIGVFDEDELEIDADPLAKTQMTESVDDQVSLEGSGSGSGLLDLTREADDTSLGTAELLDEISSEALPDEDSIAAAQPQPAAPESGEPAEPETEEEAAPAPAAAPAAAPAPRVVATAADPYEGLFTGLLVGGLLLLVFTGTIAAGPFQGFWPSYADFLMSINFLWVALGALAIPLITLGIGFAVGKATS